jgi:hypothetical protein
MSHRRWRQSVAPGVSPGLDDLNERKPSKRATDSFAPCRGSAIDEDRLPRAYAQGYQYAAR